MLNLIDLSSTTRFYQQSLKSGFRKRDSRPSNRGAQALQLGYEEDGDG